MNGGGQQGWEPTSGDGDVLGAVLFRKARASGMSCNRCGGAPDRAARTRIASPEGKPACYLAYLWRCSVCGQEWEDEALKRRNAVAALVRTGARQ